MSAKGKAKRAAKKEVKKKAAVKKVERKAAKKETRKEGRATAQAARVKKRTSSKVARVEKREVSTKRRIDKRSNQNKRRVDKRDTLGGMRITKRLNKKLEKKYGDIEPDLRPEIAEADEYNEVLAAELEEQGIPIEDPNDPIEVMTKFVQTNPELDDPISSDIYDDAFVNPEDMYAGTEEEFEKFDFKKTALRGVKGAFKGVFGEFDKYTNELEQKQQSGVELTEQEKKILAAKKKVDAQIKTTVVEKVTDSAKNIALPVLVILVLVMIFK